MSYRHRLPDGPGALALLAFLETTLKHSGQARDEKEPVGGTERGAASRSMLQAKKITLVEPIGRDTHDKSYADVPDGKRARDHGYEPLALVLA